MATKERILTGVRASTAVRCPRQATYALRDAPRRDWTPTELKRFRRGKVWEAAVKADVAAELRERGQRIRTEVPVAWPQADPIGTGHIDIFLAKDRHAVEVVSNAGATLPDAKPLQVALYTRNHPRAEAASVIAVDTHTGSDQVYPINVGGLASRLDEIEDTMTRAVRDETYLPERVCKTPLDGPAQMCPFAETICFKDWQWPERDELLVDEKMAELLADAEDTYRDAKRLADTADKNRRAVRSEVAPYVPKNEPVTIGDVTVRRSCFEKQSFSLSDARKAGFSLPDALQHFVSTSEQERWHISRRKP